MSIEEGLPLIGTRKRSYDKKGFKHLYFVRLSVLWVSSLSTIIFIWYHKLLLNDDLFESQLPLFTSIELTCKGWAVFFSSWRGCTKIFPTLDAKKPPSPMNEVETFSPTWWVYQLQNFPTTLVSIPTMNFPTRFGKCTNVKTCYSKKIN
jgi:hypothetical protein